MTIPSLYSRLPHIGTTIFTVMSALAEEHQAVNLSQGFPDFSPPAGLIDRMIHHLTASNQQYAPMAGVLSLREAIAEKVARLYGATYDPVTEITVTAGATQAIASAITASVRPGDEVIVFAPLFDSYIPAIELNGGVVRVSELQYPDYRPDWDSVKSLITPKTRLIIANTPHNPTGTVWTDQDLKTLAEIVRDTDVLIISDEVYEHMSFDGRPHQSFLRVPELRERSFVVSSFGKTYHVTGWKIAYCVAPKSLTTEFRKIHQFNPFCVHHPSQRALADFMTASPEFADELSAFYQEKRDYFRRGMASTPFTLLPCEGTYFQVASYVKVSDEDDVSFSKRLTREAGVAVIPLSVFYQAPVDHRVIRFCFAKNEATLDRAIERLSRWTP
jgi:methionine aminotransferase